LVVAGEFVVAGGQGFVVLELVEAALDDIAAPVGRPVEPAQALSSADAAADLVDPTRATSAKASMMPWVRAALMSCTAPGSAAEAHNRRPNGSVRTWAFMPCLRCLPE
jgi:hypothetical protein